MGFKCGIVGLPNVGKSSLFNALTKSAIDSQNYPFCTIEPNNGIVIIDDKRIDSLKQMINPKQTIYAQMEFVDIAGLVKGASKGEGLGNKFLAHIRQTQVLIHLVRCFENDDIIHINQKIDPINDLEIINTELILADLDTVVKALEKQQKKVKSGDKKEKFYLAVLSKIKDHLDQNLLLSQLNLDEDESILSKQLQLLTDKKQIIVANIGEQNPKENRHYLKLKEYCQKQDLKLLAICTKLEEEIAQFNDEEKKEFLAQMNIEQTGLNRLIHTGYDMLGLHTFFTAGVKEVRAWTIKKGISAPEAAGKIHNDFQKGFIRAEVINFSDYIECAGEIGAKAKGKMRLEGKEYIVQDGDIIHFRFNI